MNTKNYEIIKDTSRTRYGELVRLFAYPELNSDAKLVLFFLLCEFNIDCHITYSSISAMLRLSEGKTKRAIDQLKRNGFISITRVRGEDTKKFGGCFWKITAIPHMFTSAEADEV